MKIVVCGLSITSSWGNGHATTYRALLRALHQRKHKIVFFERNEEWYASNRDQPNPEYCELRFFENWREAAATFRRELKDCDVAVIGSYFPNGIQAADELAESPLPVKVFYDIDTPITLKSLRSGGASYLQPAQVRIFDLYLSFTGGPILEQLQAEFGARRAVACYCSFEPQSYFPRGRFRRYQCDLSYMGTYAADRQGKLEALFGGPAKALMRKKFLLAGPQYPAGMKWPSNVRRVRHLSPRWHPHFYSSSRLTLNLTRKEMVEWGFSPSVRLFEAAACGCPIVSDYWPGLNTILGIGEEVLVAQSAEEVISLIQDTDDAELRRVGGAARERVLIQHSSARRAEEFETYVSRVAVEKPQKIVPPFVASSTPAVSPQPSSQPNS